ncbi:MAG: hypothetical protein JNK74_25930 [Candidatus Hydrogenedentes bacterium]|nr:hypothetical protein [Candidatus Hydrogenedentota bacterium]
MNPKLRALIWEELRTGGVIAGWCTLVGGLCLLVAGLVDDSGGDWTYISPVALSLNMLPLLLIGLLLLYRTGNSGALTGGFSGRILLLPVETWKLAGLSLFLRAALLGAATLLSIVLCRVIFWGHGPAWVLVLVTPACYLWLQALDWLRRPTPLLAVLGFLPIFGCIGFALVQSGDVRFAFDEPFISVSAALLLLAISGVTAFLLALFAVDRTRRGARVRLSIRLGLPEAVPVPGWRVDRGFRSPRWALLWQFLCRDGFLLPVIALGYSALALLCYGVWWKYSDDDYVPILVVLDWGVWPVFALAAMIWGGLRGGAGIQRGIRPVLTEYLYPVSAAEMAVTRLWGYGLTLGGVWTVALLLSNAGFFLGENALAWRIWRDAIAANETSLRELMVSRLLLPVIILIGAWVLTAIRTRLVAWMLGLMLLYAMVMAAAHTLYHESSPTVLIFLPLGVALGLTVALMIWTRTGYRKSWPISALWLLPLGLSSYASAALWHEQQLGERLAWLPVAIILVITPAAILWAWRRGVMPARHALGCGVVWLLTILLAYPFGYWQFSGFDRTSLLYVTAFGALVVLPYPALLLDLHRKRHHDDTPLATEDQAIRAGWGLPAGLNSAAYVLLAAVLLGMAWLRWPAEPVYIETLRAQGNPATASDLAELYRALPPEDNAAHDYMKIWGEHNQRSFQWYNRTGKSWERGDKLAVPPYNIYNPVTHESIDLPPDQRLWTPFWDTAIKYHDWLPGPTAAALMNVAAKYPRESRYAIDLGSGASVSLPHLAAIRTLARAQNYEVWMAAMEDRPADALQTIKAMGPLAESLREEPILISQLVRIAVHGIMTSAVEQALNRTEFTDAQLVELQQFLSTVLPPISEHSMIAQGLIGERTFASIQPDMEMLRDFEVNMTTALLPRFLFAMDRTVTLRAYAEMEENQENRPTPLLHEIEESRNPQFVLPKIILPALDRSREAEFRCRVMHAIAATACAVERYRLANGALPETLDALVPTFLDAIPVDPFRDDQGPVSYRTREDGGYALYTWAQNRKDDGGIPRDPKKKEGNDWANGDWIFSVAPLSFRNGPQFTDTPPLEEGATTNPAAGRGRRSLQSQGSRFEPDRLRLISLKNM